MIKITSPSGKVVEGSDLTWKQICQKSGENEGWFFMENFDADYLDWGLQNSSWNFLTNGFCRCIIDVQRPENSWKSSNFIPHANLKKEELTKENVERFLKLKAFE